MHGGQKLSQELEENICPSCVPCGQSNELVFCSAGYARFFRISTGLSKKEHTLLDHTEPVNEPALVQLVDIHIPVQLNYSTQVALVAGQLLSVQSVSTAPRGLPA